VRPILAGVTTWSSAAFFVKGDNVELGYVDEGYVNYLRQTDHRVLMNKHQRPYLGAVLQVAGGLYFAPLETAKSGKRVSNQISVKVWDEQGEQDQPISYILLNDMIPIDLVYWHPIKMDQLRLTQPARYRMLLKEQHFMRKHVAQIMNKAERVYRNRTQKKIPFINQMCLDFKLLERAAIAYRE